MVQHPEVDALVGTFLHEVDARLPGHLSGLVLHGSLCWGEFFAASDIDFAAIWRAPLDDAALALLAEAHEATADAHPGRAFDGFHVTAEDLADDPTGLGSRPVYFGGRFDVEGDAGIDWVSWHEMAERGVPMRGSVPAVRVDRAALLAFTRENLDTYWRAKIADVEGDPAAVGGWDDAVAWVALGVARLHHLLTIGSMTSKSGGGQHILDHLDERWHPLAVDALRIRERPTDPSVYDDAAQRGRDLLDLLVWTVDDGCRQGTAGSV